MQPAAPTSNYMAPVSPWKWKLAWSLVRLLAKLKTSLHATYFGMTQQQGTKRCLQAAKVPSVGRPCETLLMEWVRP